ncbi:MAG TPA: SDR family oxidoreductase [Polyangiaceae bacterium]|jgi:NAD(P)-dependent dehydrogenase (short-subunit alcohol dehydrogenase family)|nr:SDR family oxidoreductase [Polyangiaceae bacterium]
MTLDNKRIVALGGTSGIGLAVVRAALDEGASVVAASHRRDSVARAEAELARRSVSQSAAQVVDVTSEGALKEFFDRIGPFDHLVYSAGEDLPLGPLVSTDLGLARARFEIRYWGAVAAVKHGVHSIREGGSIVLTSGFSARRPVDGGGSLV